MFTKKRKFKSAELRTKPNFKLRKRCFLPEEKKVFKFLQFKKVHFIILAIILFISGSIFSIFKFQSHKVKTVICLVENMPCSEAGIIMPDLIGENFFKFDFNPLIEKLFFTYPQIWKIKGTKKFPCKFLLQIELRKPKAIIEDKFQNRYFIDGEAMVFGQTTDQKSDFIIIKTEESIILSQKIVSPNILFSLDLVNNLESSLLPVEQITINNNDNLETSLKNGKIIYFTTEKDIQKQVDSLIFILNNIEIEETKKNIIDLRFENPIIK